MQLHTFKLPTGPKIEEIQRHLRKQNIDGWLLYDFHGSNPFAHELLTIPPDCVLTRRFFYWIPVEGQPVKILHTIEASGLDFLPGEAKLYLSWEDLKNALGAVLKGGTRVAMEYSPGGDNPYVSVVDAGTVELVRALGVDVVTSAHLLGHFNSVLDEAQLASHREAAHVLQRTVAHVWDLVSDHLRGARPIDEYDVQQFILSEFLAHGCVCDEGPICAVGENSALPHYMATRAVRRPIRQGDLVLIDLWCKQEGVGTIYADITRVAVAGSEPTPRQSEIFTFVREAQQAGVKLIRESLQSETPLTGAEVDDCCRQVIIQHGYGEAFPHRTGHNLGTNVHGGGTHLDNLETSDRRHLLPGTCLSVEPGIYLPGEFGIRLEDNLLINRDRSVEVTAGTQEAIICLL